MDEKSMPIHELALLRCLDGMSMAREKLSEVLHRTWQNDEVAYPLYGVLQKQRDRETARAVGRAYLEAAARIHDSEVTDIPGVTASINGRPSVTEWYVAVKQMNENQGKERKDA